MARLRAEAVRRGVSIAQLIRTAVDETMRGPDWQERRRRALAAIGRIDDDDIARRHDEYLIDVYGR